MSDGAAVAVDGEDDRQADADLGGGDGDGEQGEGLAGVQRSSRSQTSKATRLRLTALSISSTDIRTRIALRRARTPYSPMQKRRAESDGGIGEVHQRFPSACRVGVLTWRLVVLAGQDDRADQGGEQQDGEGLEGQHPVPEEARAGRLGGAGGGAVEVDPGRAEGVDDHPDQGGGGGDGHGEGGPAVAGVGVRGAADGGPGEHQTEQEEDDDGTDVDEDLHPGDELGGEQEVLTASAEGTTSHRAACTSCRVVTTSAADPTATTPRSRNTISCADGGQNPGDTAFTTAPPPTRAAVHARQAVPWRAAARARRPSPQRTPARARQAVPPQRAARRPPG